MTKRFLFGRHPLDGTFGAWLSKLGIDVTSTVDPDNFLMCPYKKNEQILKTGIFLSSPGVGQVLFSEPLPAAPYVSFMFCLYGNQINYPFDLSSYATEDSFYVTSQTDRLVINNAGVRAFYIYYVIFSRQIGA